MNAIDHTLCSTRRGFNRHRALRENPCEESKRSAARWAEIYWGLVARGTTGGANAAAIADEEYAIRYGGEEEARDHD